MLLGAVGKVWVHWVFWNLDGTGFKDENPPESAIRETNEWHHRTGEPWAAKFPNGKELEEDNITFGEWTKATEGMTDFGEEGYGGPAPPDKRHTYDLQTYTH